MDRALHEGTERSQGPVPTPESVGETPWWQAMEACPQDAVYHPEGTVATHTRMVYDALVAGKSFGARPEQEQTELLWAALLHDVGKPATTRHTDEGRITSRGHSRRGAILARRILWEMGLEFESRERICRLIRTHMRPGFFMDKPSIERELILLSWQADLPMLTALARADIQGRDDPWVPEALARLDLFEDEAHSLGVWQQPWPFPNDQSRYAYGSREDRSPHYEAYDESWGEVVVMSGLPGVGKDHWIRHHGQGRPVVSLDALREETGLAPSETTGSLIQLARERARQHLRAHESFIWNATNVSRDVRKKPIDLASDYGARVRVVYVEVGPETFARQNEGRPDPVPAKVLDRIMDKWEVPTLLEAPRVDFSARP